MRKMRIGRSIPLMLVCFAAVPTAVYAQSAVVGVVKDTSGAVLPGVTVEAASDVLIERTRTVVTDERGQYRLVDLRPGVYTVTFTLPGFNTFKRDGIELPAEFTATINAEMKVGVIEETVTVTGESPVVDVTTAVHTQVLDRDAIDLIPTGRTIQGIGQLIVGVNLNLPDTGGARGMQQTYMSTHGMTSANNTVMVDGMMVNGLQSDGSVQMYFNDAMTTEVSYQTSGIGAETSAGGVRLNMIPREGGNRFSGDFKTAYRPGTWQADNLTQRLRDRGLRVGNATDRIIDFTASQGGPIKRDRLWFFASARYFSVNNFIADTYFDDGSQGIDDQFIKSALVRLTWQVSPRNKFSAYFDEVDKYRGHDMQALYDPETASTVWYSPAYHTASAKWTSTVTSRLLVEAGWSSNLEYYTTSYQPGIERPRGTAEWFSNVGRVEMDLGGRKTATLSQATQSPARYNVQASASYVTGSHNLKTGFQWTWGTFRHTVDANGDLYQQYRSNSTGIPFTVPDAVVIRNTPVRSAERLNGDVGIYAQDSWTMKRLTVNAGLRWEYLNAEVLPGESPAGRFIPARSFPAVKNLPNWQNIAPRFAMVYDLFGTAKTALKYSLNRYNRARTTGIADDYNPLGSVTRTLTWRDLDGDDVAEGERGCVFLSPGCEINFGQLPANFGTLALNRYGGYPRTWNLEHGLELQHELLPRLSVTGSWFHGSFRNLTTTINQNLTQADFAPIQVFNPLDGTPVTAYNISADAQRRAVDNLDTFDPEREQIYNAFNMEFKARPGRGAQVFGGVSIERELQVNCTSPDNPNSLRFCNDRDNDIPWRTNVKLAGTYPVVWGVTVSAAFQSNQGPTSNRRMVFSRTTRYPANCPAPCPAGAVIAPTLNASSLTVDLIPERATFVERITQLDLKIAKTFSLGRIRVSPALEIFNINNTDAVISYVSTNALAAGSLRPNSIMQGRMIGVGAQVRW